MSRTAVIVSDAEDSRALCRLCMIYHEYFVNIFIPNDAFRICAEEAIHDLLSLKVAVGDGLPSNICHQCVNKLMEFRDFKEMCRKTAEELRKYYLDNFLRVSKIKDEDAADVETTREGSSQENTFLNNIHLTEVYINTPDELAIGNVSHAKEELWSTENTLVVKEEANGEEHRIEGDVPVNALTSFAVHPLAVDTMEEAQEPKAALGEGNRLGDKSPHHHTQVTEVFLPMPEELAIGIVCHVEEDSRPAELMVKEEIGEGLDCSENDVPVGSFSSVNVDPLAVDTTVDPCYNIEGLTEKLENESDKFGVDIQGISQNQVLNNPSCDPVDEEKWHLKYPKPNSNVVDCFPERRVEKQKKNVTFYASCKKFSQLNNRARPVRNVEREQLCHQAENTSYSLEYICNYCSSRYSEKKPLALHIKRHVDGMRSAKILPKKDFQPRISQKILRKAFKCNECGKIFSKRSYLIKHSVVHTGVKRFKCNECGKTFTQSGTLKTHLLIHSGVKPFKCNECGQMFTLRGTLNRHSVVHTGVKPFKCNECGKAFSRKGHLNEHSVVHTGVKSFKCNQCGKMFTQRSTLYKHLVFHTGVKRFKCNECGKMFTKSSDLNRHSVIHTGVKPFKCDFCGKQFKWRSTFNHHLLNHTDRNPSK